jgi:uncharacterized protein
MTLPLPSHAKPACPPVEPAESAVTNWQTIDGIQLKQLMLAGLAWLNVHQKIVNALNVFPIPDGDTGTNMLLTMQAALREVEREASPSVGTMAHGIAHGALMGARGNSGVILSQIWRGFARGLDAQAYMDSDLFARAMQEARDTAYKGVMRPVEGTILTVVCDTATAAQAAADERTELPKMLERMVAAADESVRRTPELLPVLREAGVVDAGGKGFFLILEGMLKHMHGQPLDTPAGAVLPLQAIDLSRVGESIEAGQDFEVVLDFTPTDPLDLSCFFPAMEQMGTSIQLGQDDSFYRLHIHVPLEKRYEPIEYAMRLGTVTRIAMENLQVQMRERSAPTEPEPLRIASLTSDQIAVVAVVPGAGLARVFASLDAAAIVSGGQTMNPSTEEILAAFEALPSERIIILPNNKNIQLAAEQTAVLTGKQVVVVPTRSIPQGIAAMLAYQRDGDLAAIARSMTQAIQGVETGEITRAIRSVGLNGVQVQEGQLIGLHNGELVQTGESLEELLLALLNIIHAEKRELITLYWGADLTPAKADALADHVRDSFPGLEVEIHEGGQPHYPLILSVE